MKLPLAYSLKNRASSLSEDAKLLNGYVESRGDPKKGGITTVEKRPAMDSAFELPSGTGQGIYVPNTPDGDGEPGVVIGDILTRAPTPKTKRLRFGVQPSDVALNTAISPSVTVRILDSLGNVVNSSANVTVSLSSNPTGATLGGTLTQAASAGTATFNDLTLNRSGDNFILGAASTGLNSGTSDDFTVSTKLSFTVQPSSALPNTTLDPVEVTAVDSASATDTNYTGEVTLAVYSGSGALSGTTTVTAVGGVATFSNLSIDTVGLYQLAATGTEVSTAYPPSRGISDSFAIANYELVAAEVDVPGVSVSYLYSLVGGAGSISPTTVSGATIVLVRTQIFVSPAITITTFTLAGNRTQDFFTSITLGATTLTSASASYAYNSGNDTTNWVWNSAFVPSAGTFELLII